jgi:hypothetical protein
MQNILLFDFNIRTNVSRLTAAPSALHPKSLDPISLRWPWLLLFKTLEVAIFAALSTIKFHFEWVY